MKIGLLESQDNIVVTDVPVPKPKPWEALVKIDAVSICNGTDAKILHGTFPGTGKYPVLPGHESTGIVVEVGSAVTTYKVGDRVLRPSVDLPDVLTLWGAYSEYGIVQSKEDFLSQNPDGQTDWRWAMRQIVPPGIPADEATILITLKETYSWLKRFGVDPKSRVLVLGAGPVSLCYAYWARFFGAERVAVGMRNLELKDRPLRFGADTVIDLSADDLRSQAMEVTGGEGFDRIVDAVGNADLLCRAIGTLSPGGYIGVYGIADASAAGMGCLSVPRAAEYTLTIFGPDEFGAHEEVMSLVTSGKVRPADFISHRLPFESIREGFELIASREAVKVVLEI